MPQTYSAAQIVGKNLIAARPVDLKRSPDTKAATIYVAQAGQTIGTVYSYVGGGEKGPLWWMFHDQNGKAYYTKHEVGAYSLDVLQAQGVLTVEEERKQAEEKKKEQEGGYNPFGDMAAGLEGVFSNVLKIGAVVIGGLIVYNVITEKK
jgi:hypothetical protein